MAEDGAQGAVDVAGLGLHRPAGLGLEHATEAAADDLMVVDEDEPDGVGFGHSHSQVGYGRRGKAGLVSG